MGEKYISLDKALAIFNDIHPLDYNAQAYRSQLSKIPVADVRPVVRGKWVYDHWCEFKCSNCETWSKSEPYRGRENFCSNCGADMRGDDK